MHFLPLLGVLCLGLWTPVHANSEFCEKYGVNETASPLTVKYGRQLLENEAIKNFPERFQAFLAQKVNASSLEENQNQTPPEILDPTLTLGDRWEPLLIRVVHHASTKSPEKYDHALHTLDRARTYNAPSYTPLQPVICSEDFFMWDTPAFFCFLIKFVKVVEMYPHNFTFIPTSSIEENFQNHKAAFPFISGYKSDDEIKKNLKRFLIVSQNFLRDYGADFPEREIIRFVFETTLSLYASENRHLSIEKNIFIEEHIWKKLLASRFPRENLPIAKVFIEEVWPPLCEVLQKIQQEALENFFEKKAPHTSTL